MDDFREWLSDNLRYFMLGGGILLIVLILFFGIRACASGRKKSGGTETTVTEGTVTQTSSNTETQTGSTDSTQNPLVEANTDVRTLTENYYSALGEKDINALRELEVNLSPEDEARVANVKEYIEGYVVREVYTKNGLYDGDYVIYAYYDYICQGIATHVPALSELYAVKDENGALKIDGSALSDSQIKSYMNELSAGADVKALTDKVKAAYEEAQAKDSELASFLAGLGQDGGTTVSGSGSQNTNTPSDNSNTKTMTVNVDVANVRAQPESGSDIIGGCEEGQSVTVTGESGDWIQIDYNGEVGYIYRELLS